MAKKLGSYRVLSCTLAVLATVAFIIACGEGIPEDIIGNPEIKWPINQALESLTNDEERLSSIVQKPSSPSVPPDESSSSEGEDPGPGDGDSSDSGSTQSSSDGGEPSSASSPSSSSSEEVAQSSSAESPYILTCEVTTPKVKIKWTDQSIPEDKRPVVTCKTKESGAVATIPAGSINWTKDGKTFSWRSISEILGVHPDNSIQVDIKDGDVCKGEKTSCKGSLEICYDGECVGDPPKPSSSSYSSSSRSSSSHTTTTTSSSSNRSSSSATSNETKGPCLVSGSERYCRWDATKTDCDKIDSQYGYIDSGDNKCTAGNCTCAVLIKHCSDNGYLYGSSNCTGADLNGKNPSSVGCCNWDNNGGKSNCWTEPTTANCPNWLSKTKACNPNNGTSCTF